MIEPEGFCADYRIAITGDKTSVLFFVKLAPFLLLRSVRVRWSEVQRFEVYYVGGEITFVRASQTISDSE